MSILQFVVVKSGVGAASFNVSAAIDCAFPSKTIFEGFFFSFFNACKLTWKKLDVLLRDIALEALACENDYVIYKLHKCLHIF